MWKKSPASNSNIEVQVRSYDDRGDPEPPYNWRVEVVLTVAGFGGLKMTASGAHGTNMREKEALDLAEQVLIGFDVPIPLILHCPECKARHIDIGDLSTKPHRTHACQSCGFLWAPSHLSTVGVQFLPGCKNGES